MLRGTVLKKDKGTAKMQEVWNAIRIGADSYLNRQLKRILPAHRRPDRRPVPQRLRRPAEPPKPSREFGQKNAQIIIAIGRTIAFIMGASFSLIVGQLGMRMAIQANVRAASAARRSFNEALPIAYYAGTITGMLTDGLGLFGGTIIFIIFGKAAPDALLGFGFGGTLLALFMRVGGGIYTKAADVGADLVGKVEKDIPEDDPRNAAVIADLVGDNVGDCAGMAADIFESYEVTIVSGLILGLALMAIDPTHSLKWIVYPLIIRAIGVISLHPRHLHRPHLGAIPAQVPPGPRRRGGHVPVLRGLERQHHPLVVPRGLLLRPRLAAGHADHDRRRAGRGLQPPDLLLHLDPKRPRSRRSSSRPRPARRRPSSPACRWAWSRASGPSSSSSSASSCALLLYGGYATRPTSSTPWP